ncbi:MAG: serine/threonine-protein kinase [Myxococcota bacterium]
MALAPRLAAGSIFARDFKIVDLLAEGGMGAVYRVEQLSTRKPRALKLVTTRLASDPKGRQRFVREATVGASIDSEHVVEVIGAGIDEGSGRPWLAMELLDGADLGAVQLHQGALQPGQLREVIGQLCHGLAAAHRAGVVHRDLKPANVFVARSRRAGVPFTIKILDFGIAKVVQESGSRQETDTVGSPLWMAPEQLNAEQPRPATDVWALGLLGFWALTGKHYWRSAHATSSTVQALFVEQLFKPIEPPSVRMEEWDDESVLPEGFDAWFLRCLDRDPQRRYVDAEAASEALMALLPVDDQAASTLLPRETLPPSVGRSSPSAAAEATTSETTVRTDPTGWNASAFVPAEAIAAARSEHEGEATRADGGVLGADLSRGPVPGMHQPGPPRTGASPLVIAGVVALAVAAVGVGVWLNRSEPAEVARPQPPPKIQLPPDVEIPAASKEAETGEANAGSESAESGTPPKVAVVPEDLALARVVPLRTQLNRKAHAIEFLGWSAAGHRFALRAEYRDPRSEQPNELTLVQVHDALTGTMIESFLWDRTTGASSRRFSKLGKAAAEAKPRTVWKERREELGIAKQAPRRTSPAGGSLRIAPVPSPEGSALTMPSSRRGVAFHWAGFEAATEAADLRMPVLNLEYEQGEQVWPLAELAAPWSASEVLARPRAEGEAPAVTGRVLAHWSPQGRRAVLLFETDARPDGDTPLTRRTWTLRTAGPQVRILEAGAGQRRAREAALALEAAGLPVTEISLREPEAAVSELRVARGHARARRVAETAASTLPQLPAAKTQRIRGGYEVVIVLGQDAAQ